MPKHYTQKEIEEICLAFEGTHGCGLINGIVFSEYEKERVIEVNPQKLAKFFSSFKCGGVARLINSISIPDEIMRDEFGSHSIDFYGVTKGPFSFENAMSLVGITMGSRKKQISPLEWLSYLAKGFDRLSDIQKSGFNDVCEDFALLNEALASGKGVCGTTERDF